MVSLDYMQRALATTAFSWFYTPETVKLRDLMRSIQRRFDRCCHR